jgi:predicted transcriptional regulator of viral defense system
MNENSLRVAVSRLIKAGEIIKLIKGYYCLNNIELALEKIALEIYEPSYLSFEWALGHYNILSQKSYSLTLATTKRAKQINVNGRNIAYHHLGLKLFWGYMQKNDHLIAEPEKAFLDLAYLSLNGCAKFDPEEMNLKSLNKNKLNGYLKKFNNQKLEKIIKQVLT